MLVGSCTSFQEIAQIAHYVDFVEIRLDHFSIDQKPPFPCIFTFRKQEQGGACKCTEKRRIQRLETFLAMGPEYCDIEADTDPSVIERLVEKFPNVKWIGSYHNFEKTPEDLDALLKEMENPHFSIFKVACKANTSADMLRLMLFLKRAKKPLSAISLGPFGKVSRIIAPTLGSALDYVGLSEEMDLHRYSLRTLLETFHYRKLERGTPIYALIGDPVEKSIGDLFHNAYFQGSAVYVKVQLKQEELKEAFSFIRQLGIKGLSVTMPLKERILLELDEAFEEIGSINTVVFQNGKALGQNTDGEGALNAIEKQIQVKGRKIAIIGAGGTARAIAFESKRRGASVCIFNRTPAKAKLLAEELGVDWSQTSDIFYDILISTLPPNVADLPVIRANTVVMDVVYDPKETPLLKMAKKFGCRCIYGEEMFVEQALLQQKIFRSRLRWGRRRS